MVKAPATAREGRQLDHQNRRKMATRTAHGPLLVSTSAGTTIRPQVRGRFLFVDEQKLYVRGVTYGPFRPDEHGNEYHTPRRVNTDFAAMVANGINAVRTYTVPPRWLLDAAHRHGLYVMVGLPWEQHITFLDQRKRTRSIEEQVRVGVQACAGHPAVLCYAIGNEIPSSIVRWHGARSIERFLRRLHRAAKEEDPGGLVTYVNYPTTEYLRLSFLDFVCFNVYLEVRARLAAYLARLQNLTGDRPLVMAEVGLDSRRNGEVMQAEVLEWQVRTSFQAGCAGLFVFSWTDEWQRGGYEIDDWDFGLTDRKRQPKPALASVRNAFAEVPFPADLPWPRISVVVCTYNGACTIRDCLEGLMKLEYPDFEVIVVDDGSTDSTAAIAAEYDVRLITTGNHGLSSARNSGMVAATGEIVAYLDDDARPDPHWLHYLAYTLISTEYAGVGGPNLPPPDDGPLAQCVANAPGGPAHVLLSDHEAEHIPGCNMAFRKTCLQEVNGFDPRYRVAGDDVDLCWRLQQRGWKLGFHPAAVVWHRRRSSLGAYWKQQLGYGKAEGLLAQKWPGEYNAVGHHNWAGRIYDRGLTRALLWPPGRIYHGTWGSAPFQSLYGSEPGLLGSFTLMPEWLLLILLLSMLVVLSPLWAPLHFALPLALLAGAVSIAQAVLSASRASFTRPHAGRSAALKFKSIVALLHLLQPAARLYGRLRHCLTQPRVRGTRWVFPKTRTITIWSEEWQEASAWLHAVETRLRVIGASALRGSEYDRWDLETRGHVLGSARVLMAIEEHGAGRQLVCFRIWPAVMPGLIWVVVLLAGLAVGAGFDGAWVASGIFGTFALLTVLYWMHDAAVATATMLHALEKEEDSGCPRIQ